MSSDCKFDPKDEPSKALESCSIDLLTLSKSPSMGEFGVKIQSTDGKIGNGLIVQNGADSQMIVGNAHNLAADSSAVLVYHKGEQYKGHALSVDRENDHTVIKLDKSIKNLPDRPVMPGGVSALTKENTYSIEFPNGSKLIRGGSDRK